jgi:hypothetical protein
MPNWSVPTPATEALRGDDAPRVTIDSPHERAWTPAYLAPAQ